MSKLHFAAIKKSSLRNFDSWLQKRHKKLNNMIKVNIGIKTRRYEEENILEKLDRLSQQESKLRQDVNKRDEFVDTI